MNVGAPEARAGLTVASSKMALLGLNVRIATMSFY